ncbi:hypothetical protein BGZ90_002139 [Linnemannia elongata]|nr:hypothetical protein BGZ90_002139 [Linnemannia elongata]
MDSDAADATTKKPRKARGKTILSNTLSSSIPSQVKKENNNMLALTASSQPLFEQGGEYFFDVIDSRDSIKECGPESISSAPISCRHTSIVVRSELLDASQEHKNGTEAISPSRSLTQDPVRRRASGWDFVKPLSTRQQRIHQTCEYPGAQARSESSTSTPESYGQASTVVKSELLDASQEHNGTEAISPSRSLTRDADVIRSREQEELDGKLFGHDATHFKVPCEVTNCMRWFHREHDRDRHLYTYHLKNHSDLPPIEPLEGYDGAFIITVGYASASGDDGKLDLERNVIYFGNEATLDRGRIMMQGEIATPVAFLDQPALFTKQQLSDYIRLTMNGYVVGSPTKDARCRNCSVARVWRAFGLQVTPTLHNPVLYFNHRSLCSLCFLKERRRRIETTLRSHFKIAPDADLLLAIISKLNANHVWPTFLGLRYCAKCHDVLNLQNTHFTLGTSTNIPISVPGYCDSCSYLVCEETRINDPLQQLATWIVRHKNDFNSPRMTAGTAWTLVVQGYNTIPAQYSEWEEIQLRLLVSSSVPRCFYTNQELSMHPHTCATTKLSFDRLVFDHQGKSLPYEDQNQVIVTASLFINRLTLQQRVDRLEQLRLAPTDGSFDAADAAFGKVELYDDIMERKRGWTPSLDKAWETFASRARSRGRLEMNKYEYRMKNCIVIEGSLNLGKAYMSAFQSSDGVQGSKGRYAIDTLRDELTRQERLSRPYRSNYVARLVEMGRQPHIWKKDMKTQPILTH